MFSSCLMRPVFAVLIMISFANLAMAHVEGVTDTSVEIRESWVGMEYTIPVDELQMLLDGSGEPIAEAIPGAFVIKSGDQVCPAVTLGQKALENIGSEQFFLQFDCGSPIENFSISYPALDFLEDDHENIVRFSLADQAKYFLLNAESPQFEVPVKLILDIWAGRVSEDAATGNAVSNDLSAAEEFEEGLEGARYYFPVGLEHILLGYDHVLFLLGLLLLPFRFKPLVALATSFTLAHSITLGLSVFDLVTLPVLMVEIAIAASIVYVAAENLWELRAAGSAAEFKPPLYRRLTLTFLFGLIHGFGFSFILREMGLGDQALGALLFFNLGVEAGQLAIIALAFPLLFFIFKTTRGILFARVGSVLVGAVGLFWLVERVFF